MKDKLLIMLALQDKMNSTVHPEWRTQNFKWTRAIMVEGVEALEHYGWKWWKKQEPEFGQIQIELVDIWHFIMSHKMIDSGGRNDKVLAAYLAELMSAGPLEFMVKSDPRINMEMLIGRAATGEIHMHAFLALLEQFQMSFDDLYRLYVAKNVLNMFRQDHGYKQGTYVKTWMGEEDNVVLDNLLKLRPDATPEMLEARLGQLYNKATATETAQTIN